RFEAAPARVDAHGPVSAVLGVHGEALEEPAAQPLGSAALGAPLVGHAEPGVQARHRTMRGEGVRLDFGQRDWLLGWRAVAVVHRIRRVLPALVAKALARVAIALEE